MDADAAFREAEVPVRQDEASDVPESPRHAAGEMERYRLNQLALLEKAVRDQEEKVEERRKALVAVVRNRGIIYKGDGQVEAGVAGNGDAAGREKDKTDAAEYLEAKRNFETDQQWLQEMKLRMLKIKIQEQGAAGK